MKKYFIKPIKVRFMSGGEECATLEQLRLHFSPKDIVGSFPQFVRWLHQNKTCNSEIHVILNDVNSNDFLIKSPRKNQDDFLCLYKIFFKEYIEKNKIRNIVDLLLNWVNNNEYEENRKLLERDVKSIEHKEEFFLQLYEKDKRVYSEDRWKALLRELTEYNPQNSNYLYRISKIFIEDFNSSIEGMSFMKKARKNGDINAKQYLEDYCKLSEDFKKWYKKMDEDEWKKNKDDDTDFDSNNELKELANSWHEKWILETQSLIHKIIKKDDYYKLYDYIGYIREFDKDDSLKDIYPYDINPGDFLNFFRDRGSYTDRVNDNGLMKDIVKYNGIMFVEIRFVLGLLYRNNKDYKVYGDAILGSMEAIYPLARYILNEKYCNSERINTLRNKINKDFNEGLRYYCTNMVDFMTE